jgi:hypothetical protein
MRTIRNSQRGNIPKTGRVTITFRKRVRSDSPNFLIGTLRLEFSASRGKQTAGSVSNRDEIGLLHLGFFCDAPLSPPVAVVSQTSPARVSSSNLQPLTSNLQNPWPPWSVRRGGRLIYGSAIKSRANVPRFSDMQNSNRRHSAYFSYDSSRPPRAVDVRRRISN